MGLRISEQNGGVRFVVKVVPGASRDRVVGVLGDALKVAVSQPASGGAANAAVVKLLASWLSVQPRSVQIVRGHTIPRKDIFVSGIGGNVVEAHVAALQAGE